VIALRLVDWCLLGTLHLQFVDDDLTLDRTRDALQLAADRTSISGIVTPA
jgi:hypothetical protein